MNNFCYIHIPFCTSKCKYCRFASYWILDSLKVDLYVKHLISEIEASPLTPILKGEGNFLKSIYFGWWTPSVLNITQLELIINTLKNKFSFDKNIEISLEATPITITRENLIWWKKLWINRLSIWVQTLNNDSLIEIWRGEKWDIINALDFVASSLPWGETERGINISIDFILGLPFVKKWEIKKDIEFILNKYDFIKHVSFYMLEEYYDIPDEIDSKFENIRYPNNWNKIWLQEDEYLDEYISVSDFLKEKWFAKYEISNFAKKWYECKHNKAYWDHSNIFAFWLWAHGFIDGYRYSNSEDFLKYYSKKIDFIEKLDQNDIFLEKLMFQLRTSWINENIYKKLDNKKIYQFIEDWYMYYENWVLKISNKWILILDFILKEII